MNLVDLIAVAIIGISALLSLRVGLLREMFALGSLLLGLVGAIILGRAYAHRVPDYLGSRAATQVAFFVISFLGVYIVVGLIGGIVSRATRAVKLGFVDHMLGFMFGAVRGMLLCFLLIVLLTLILPSDSTLLAHSQAYALAQGPMRVFASWLPAAAGAALADRPAAAKPIREERGGPRRGTPI
jgi:membrane protein required for colicin V production